jgi:hypothetical protein
VESTDFTQFQQVSEILTINKPVGTIHITVNPANPATYLGYGTWVAFGAGKVLIGLNAADPDFDTVLETGGAKTSAIADHTHTTPAHVHPSGTSVGAGPGANAADASGGDGTSGASGAGSVSTVQPYIVVYMWRRTA